MAELRKLGNFELMQRIGQGGMGAVYKARQVTLDRIVALKVLPPTLAKQPTFIERFLREARASARLSHPNIVSGIDVGEDGGVYYFAMEFIEGSSAKSLIRQGGQSEEQVLKIGSFIADALAHAHGHGILHRDIKPDNILIDNEGTPKLCDLGLARLDYQTEDEKGLTQDGATLGTPYYMSPEQARGQHDLDPKTDLYSLGATLYHLLTGKPIFDGATAAVIMSMHVNTKCSSPVDAGAHASKGLVAILAKLLTKDRADRYKSAAKLVEDLNRVAKGESPQHAALSPGKWPFVGIAPGLQSRKAGTGGAANPSETTRKPRNEAAAGATKWLPLLGGAAAIAIVAAFFFGGNKPKTPDLAVVPHLQPQAEHASVVPSVSPVKPVKAVLSAEELKRHEEAADAAAKKFAGEANALAAQGKFDSAIALWEKAAAEQAGLIAPRAAKATAEIRGQAEAKLQGPLELAEKCLTEKRWADGRKALDAAGDIEYGAWGLRLKNLRAKLAAGEQAEVDAAKTAALASLEKALAQHLNTFVDATLKGDLIAARKASADAKAEHALKDLEAKVQAMSDVCAALEKIDAARLAPLEALKDGKVHTFEKTKERVTGIVTGITSDSIAVHVNISGGSFPTKIRFADLLPSERKRLAGNFKPATPSEFLALCIGALATGDTQAAMADLSSLKDYPLAPAYQARLDEKIMAALEAAAKPAWEAIMKSAGTGKIPEQKIKDLTDKFAAFEKEYGKTKFATSVEAEMAALAERLFLQINLGGGVKLELVLISPGKFMMGSPAAEAKRMDFETQHPVMLTQPFYMGKYPVTQEQYEILMGKNPSVLKAAKNPVEMVTWNDAQDFCARASKKTDKTVKLPTEAEWEYACRAGSTTAYYFGDNEANLGDYCWYKDNSADRPPGDKPAVDKPGDRRGFATKMIHPVGGKKQNAWGLYDMHGNVCQWCQDWLEKYSELAAVDPQGPAQGFRHVLRGGSSQLSAGECRSAYRIGYPAERFSGHVGGFGFRVIVVPPARQ